MFMNYKMYNFQFALSLHKWTFDIKIHMLLQKALQDVAASSETMCYSMMNATASNYSMLDQPTSTFSVLEPQGLSLDAEMRQQLEKDVRIKDDLIADIQEQLLEQNGQLETMKKQLETVPELQAQLEEKSANLEALQNELLNSKQSLSEPVVDSQLDDIKLELQNKIQELDKITLDYTESQNAIEALQTQAKTWAEEKNSSTAAESSLTEERDSLRESLQAKEACLASVQQEVEVLKEQLLELHKDSNKYVADGDKIAELRATMDKLKAEKELADEKVSSGVKCIGIFQTTC